MSADFAYLARYKEENQHIQPLTETESWVVFMGDSITEFWQTEYPDFFKHKPFLNRGISGQTTPQMLLRFHQDVIDLKPHTVHLLAGTNDIAGNTGISTLKMIQENLQSMVKLAEQHHIQTVIGTLLPAVAYPWRPGIAPSEKIVELNAWIRDFAQHNARVCIDYYRFMVDEHGCLNAAFTEDGVHPNAAGYACMSELALPVLHSSQPYEN